MQRHLTRLAYRSSHRTAALAALLVGALVITSYAPGADARPRPRSKRFTANKTFGLGLMFGAPTGLSGKYFLGADTAIDFGLGYIPRYQDYDGTHVHADFLWHPASMVDAAPFSLPIYFGLGARLYDRNSYSDDSDDDFRLGLRVPLGIAIDFNNVPLDIFIELAFVLDFLSDYDNDLDSSINLAMGIRYYFF